MGAVVRECERCVGLTVCCNGLIAADAVVGAEGGGKGWPKGAAEQVSRCQKRPVERLPWCRWDIEGWCACVIGVALRTASAKGIGGGVGCGNTKDRKPSSDGAAASRAERLHCDGHAPKFPGL